MTDKSKNVTVCMIAKNCADMLRISLEWATEHFENVIVVVDTMNTDDTMNICAGWAQFRGVRVIINEFEDFSIQKQIAFDAAKTDWVLMVDSDEIFEDVPWDKFVEGLNISKNDAATFKRFNLQRDYKHFKYPAEIKLRLIRREMAKMDGKPVDEDPDPTGLGILQSPYAIFHFGHIRNYDALVLKGRDRIKFEDRDGCDGEGLREHGDSWFIVRNEQWDDDAQPLPVQYIEQVEEYYGI